MDLKELLPVAIRAAEKACAKILDVYDSNDFNVELKGDNSPLTLADRKAHKEIVKILQPYGLPILSEEGKDIPYSERKNWNLFWMVDPLDGTKEFIKRNGEFTVNIALIENNKPVLGVVAVPVENKIYYGANGLGAFVRSKSNILKLRSRSEIHLSKQNIRVVASRSHLNEETNRFIQTLNNPILVSKGSSLKFMMLADGEADIYPRFAPTMEWDTAAAHAVVNQLGISVYRQGHVKDELVYNKEVLLNPSFVCR